MCLIPACAGVRSSNTTSRSTELRKSYHHKILYEKQSPLQSYRIQVFIIKCGYLRGRYLRFCNSLMAWFLLLFSGDFPISPVGILCSPGLKSVQVKNCVLT